MNMPSEINKVRPVTNVSQDTISSVGCRHYRFSYVDSLCLDWGYQCGQNKADNTNCDADQKSSLVAAADIKYIASYKRTDGSSDGKAEGNDPHNWAVWA